MPTETDDVERLLRQLSSTTGAVPFSRLYELSDLIGGRLAGFRTVWDTLPTYQRRRLMSAMVELAEASYEVNFDTIYRHGLEDPDDQVRAAAIEGLWENEEVTLIGPLISMLRTDPSERVRAAAASALGRFVLAGELEQLEEPVQARVVTELLTIIHLAGESSEVRRRAIESVAYACQSDVNEVLETAYYDEDESMRLSAVTGMGRSCERQWGEIILKELESQSPAMRYEAAWASGEMGLRQAVPLLTQLLDEPDRQIRIAAIWALGQVGGEPAKEALLDAYDNSDEDDQAAIDEALAEHALAEGELDFLLYEVGEDEDEDLFEDDLFPLWTDGDEPGEDEDEDLEDWNP
jgi:HEAT repeat protein